MRPDKALSAISLSEGTVTVPVAGEVLAATWKGSGGVITCNAIMWLLPQYTRAT